MGTKIQNFNIFDTLLFLIVLENPLLAHEKPIIPEVTISASEIGIP